MEYSAFLGRRAVVADARTPFAATNYFQNSTWGSLATPTNDSLTWMGYTRHQNILNQISTLTNAQIIDAQRISELVIEQGGARDNETTYQVCSVCLRAHTHLQVIYDSASQNMSVRSIVNGNWWTLDMRAMFEAP
jgi:hypothetical protein